MLKQFLFLCFVFSCIVESFAQNPSHHLLNDDNGLPSNEVYSVVQDHHGFIWIGCDAGLYRYNGVRFKQYAHRDQKSSAITGLTLSADSVLYCYNFSNQIYFVEKDSLHEIKSWQGKRDKGFANIAVDAKNRLWACSSKYLYNYNKQTQLWDSIFFSNHNFYPPANIISGSSGKQIWSSLSMMMLSIENNVLKSHIVEFAENDEKELSTYHFVADDSIIWIFSKSKEQVYQNSANVFKRYDSHSLSTILKGRKITYVKAQGQYFYITTYSGFIIYDKWNDKATLLFEKESFSNYLQDKEGNVWLATLQNGIYFIPQMEFRVWNENQSGIPENRITDLYVTDKTVHFSMLNGHVGILDKLTKSIQSHYAGIKSDIRAIYFDDTLQSLFFNAGNTLFQLKKQHSSILLDGHPPLKKMIKADGYYIVCTSFDTYVYQKMNRDKVPITLATGWSRDAAYLDQGNWLYIATNTGLIRGEFLNGIFRYDTTFDKGVLYKALFADEETQKVFALNYKGELYECTSSSFKYVSTIPSSVVPTDVVHYGDKYIVATNKGLWMYKDHLKQWSNISRTSGLVSNDIVALKMDNENLWLATSKGLQSIALDFEITKPLPNVFLNKIKIDDTIVAHQDLQLKHNSSLLLFPEAVAYSSLGNFQFAYRINTVDTNWIFVNAQNESILLSGIPNGQFTIELAVVDYLGRFSQNRILLKGTVIPPFWQRWWFYAIIASLGIGIAYLVFLMRLKVIRQKQQEAIDKLNLENELNLSQQTALKAQMNPHFIFNVLNSIKSFIYENDKKSAAEYLSKFAELVRGVLMMSASPMIKLSDEVKALELYIQLEAMLLEPPFEYSINIAENMDIESITIPSLIIQPFVENAFKHGLRHKQGEKKLQISLALNDITNQLIVSISDNGIGRKKSAAIYANDSPNHQSFAIIANKRRLDLLNKNSSKQLNVYFEDKVDDQGEALGTIVTITIAI